MSLFDRWLRGRSPGNPGPRDQDPTTTLLAQARELARAGDLHEAARAYSKLTRDRTTPDVWLEHAEVLLAIGDYFRAASNANRVLEVDPTNSKALELIS